MQPEILSPHVTSQYRHQAPLICFQHNRQAIEYLLIAYRFVSSRLVPRGLCHRKQLHIPLHHHVNGVPDLTFPSSLAVVQKRAKELTAKRAFTSRWRSLHPLPATLPAFLAMQSFAKELLPEQLLHAVATTSRVASSGV